MAVRNVRREGMELLKKLDKDGQMSEDDHHKNSAKVQELTDKLDQGDRPVADQQGSRDQAGLRSTGGRSATAGPALRRTPSAPCRCGMTPDP